MSNAKAIAAVCEICGGKLMLRSADTFECENCGANYPKDWVRAKVQEIIGTVRVDGPVEVLGIENADALYNRALGWLDLHNEDKAVDVLNIMTEKYPGDNRGWHKIEEIKEKQFNERELVIQAVCEDIKCGQGRKYLKGRYLPLSDKKSFRIEFELPIDSFVDDNVFKFSYSEDDNVPISKAFEAFCKEGQENANFFHDCKAKFFNIYVNSSKKFKRYSHGRVIKYAYILDALNRMWCEKGEWFYDDIIAINGNLIFHQIDGKNTLITATKVVLSKLLIQQSFLEIEKIFDNNLCPRCTKSLKTSFWERFLYCPNCDK